MTDRTVWKLVLPYIGEDTEKKTRLYVELFSDDPNIQDLEIIETSETMLVTATFRPGATGPRNVQLHGLNEVFSLGTWVSPRTPTAWDRLKASED